MSSRFNTVTIATFIMAALLFSSPLQAKVTVQEDFQGTLVVTFPDGKVQMYDSGEALPDIPSGTTIEVFGGKVAVSLDEGDSLKLTCLGSEATIGGGSSASMGCGETDGKLNVDKGSAQVTQTSGAQKTIAAGQEYEIQSPSDNTGDDNEPPTAEGDPLGTTAPEVAPPDSRSMEASLSQ